MSIRASFHLLVFVVFPVGAFALAVLGQIHPVFGLLPLPYTVLIAVLASRLRCPKCHARVHLQTRTIFGVRVQVQSPYIRRYCDHCRHDLSGKGEKPPPASRMVARGAFSLFPPLYPNMPLLFGAIAVAGLVCGAGQLLFALTGLGSQFVVPFVRESPLGRPLVGLNGALVILLALAILKRHPYGLLLYFLSMGYGFCFTLYFLWHADIPAHTAAVAIWACFALFVLAYGYVNRGWFRPKPKDGD